MMRWASSNSLTLDRCVMSPVWIIKVGLIGSVLILPIDSSSVPFALGLAGLSNQMWLSLICKESQPLGLRGHRPVDEAEGLRHPCRDRPQNPGAGPSHAFQYLAPIDAIASELVGLTHCYSPS